LHSRQRPLQRPQWRATAMVWWRPALLLRRCRWERRLAQLATSRSRQQTLPWAKAIWGPATKHWRALRLGRSRTNKRDGQRWLTRVSFRCFPLSRSSWSLPVGCARAAFRRRRKGIFAFQDGAARPPLPLRALVAGRRGGGQVKARPCLRKLPKCNMTIRIRAAAWRRRIDSRPIPWPGWWGLGSGRAFPGGRSSTGLELCETVADKAAIVRGR